MREGDKEERGSEGSETGREREGVGGGEGRVNEGEEGRERE